LKGKNENIKIIVYRGLSFIYFRLFGVGGVLKEIVDLNILKIGNFMSFEI